MKEQLPRQFRPVNPTLGKAPKLGPFPGNQVLPWAAICLVSYWVCKMLLGFSWLWTGIITAWGISTWWILTGHYAWKFLSKFLPVPFWVRGYGRYQRLLNSSLYPQFKTFQPQRRR